MNTEARARTPLAASTEHPSCDRCFHRRYCLPSAVENERWMQQVITGHSRVCKGGSLFRAGQPAAKVYVVHTGAFKSVICLPDGRQRIVSFHEAGDFMGLDAFTGQWGTDAIGLEASEACEIDIDMLDAVARQIPLLQRYLRRVISDRLVRAQQDQCALGTMHVTARMIRFLLNLSARYRARGLSGDEFTLRMTRGDIGDYVGCRLETVSRVFSELQHAGLIDLERRDVRIVDHSRLARLRDSVPEWSEVLSAVPRLRCGTLLRAMRPAPADMLA